MDIYMKSIFSTCRVVQLIAVTICFFSISALADAATFFSGKFYCTVQQYQTFHKGVLRNDVEKFSNWFGDEKKKSFFVNSIDGTVIGKSISNDMFEKLVIDSGKQEGQAVKILWRTHSKYSQTGYTHAAYLEIYNYVDTDEKPFILLRGQAVISGVCK